MNNVFLGIGGNLGDRIKNIKDTIEIITERVGKPEKISSIYLSEPWGFRHAKYFTNIVIKVNTELSCEDVLSTVLAIETELKRVRSGNGYEGRTMDIDILFFNDEIINKATLIVPHPRIEKRLFVLLPMNEIESELIHPESKKKIKELLNICNDKSKIKKLNYGL